MDEIEQKLWDEMYLRVDAHVRSRGGEYPRHTAAKEADEAVLARRESSAKLSIATEGLPKYQDNWPQERRAT